MRTVKEVKEMVKKTLEEKIEKACEECLDFAGLDSGDISPITVLVFEDAQEKLIDVVEQWIVSRFESEVEPLKAETFLCERCGDKTREIDKVVFAINGGSYQIEVCPDCVEDVKKDS